jgi:hypothetical protein
MKPAGFNRRVAEKAEKLFEFMKSLLGDLGASAVDFVFFAGLSLLMQLKAPGTLSHFP